MKKSELIAILNSVEGDPEIIMSKDSEGNRFSPCANWSTDRYISENTWSGELEYSGGEGTNHNAIPAVILWPTN